MMIIRNLFFRIFLLLLIYDLIIAISPDIENTNEFLTDLDKRNDTQITVGINYEKLHLNKTLLDQFHCKFVEPCHERKLFEKYYTEIGRYMIDTKNKILMEFTPKAGCTAAVTMFLRHLGYVRNVHYSIWPHTFREEYLYPKCGMGTACLFLDNSWYRFKVVRNPYDRAVSSYLQLCRYPQYSLEIVKPEKLGSLSFQSFLETIVKFPTRKMEKLGNGHAGYQALAYERHAYVHNRRHRNDTIKLFDHIVKVETMHEDLEKFVNPATGAHFLPDYKGDHLAKRHNETHSFVGNVPWDELKSRIPEDYGLFYNSHLKGLVAKIFYWDITIYNYTFPFTLVGET